MSVRNLNYLLKPKSIALIGADRRPQAVGTVVARNLFNAGFDGPILPVNPRERAVEGVLTYPSVADLPLAPDLAVICEPAETVAATIDALGRRGTRAAIVVSGGFNDEIDGQTVLDAARPYLLRVLGPNSLGAMVPGRGINASSGHIQPHKGDVALVAQSAMVITSIVDWATARGFGFSHLISLGDRYDVDFADLLDYLAADPSVRAILLYIESVRHTRKFLSAARSAARQKPVVVIKAGRSLETVLAGHPDTRSPDLGGSGAGSSDLSALARTDAVYNAVFRRAGILRVRELDELFDAVGTLSIATTAIDGDRLAILTNGGDMGLLAADTLVEAGGRLAGLTPETLDALNSVLGPSADRRSNPLRIGGDAPPKRYADAFAPVLEDRGHDGVLVIHCPTATVDSLAAARAVMETVQKRQGRRHPVLTSWMGEGPSAEARRLFVANRIPSYETPSHAVRAFMHLVEYRRSQELLMETPPSVPEGFEPDTPRVGAIIAAALAEGRDRLNEVEAAAVLAAYHIPVVDTRHAATPAAAADLAMDIDGPTALKVMSRDIPSKSDVGGVSLHLSGPDEVRAEAEAMLERVRAVFPAARIDGFAVQEMVIRADAYELFIGMTENPQFGPVILFGQGGIGTEVVDDFALALPPLNMRLARDLMSRTRIWRQLKGFRTRAPVDIDAVELTCLKVSQLIVDFPEIVELDINPLLAGPGGVTALDGRIRIAAPTMPGTSRLAIRPYPKELECDVGIRDGRRFRVRPILPEDEPLVHEMFSRMTPEDIRLRFFAPMKRLSHQAAARLTQIDYDREMGLLAIGQEPPTGRTVMFGVVRIAADPDNLRAEYAVMVRSDMKGQGLGYILMNKILDYARARGIKEIYGEVLRENTNMLAMCRTLGFVRHENLDEPGVVEVSIDLGDG
jgi:acetyltransferase